MGDDKPCCAAEALRRIRQIPIRGITTGITMLDESIAPVRELDRHSDTEICAALMKQIRIYNYIPKGIEEEYAQAILEEYKKTVAKSNTKKFE